MKITNVDQWDAIKDNFLRDGGPVEKEMFDRMRSKLIRGAELILVRSRTELDEERPNLIENEVHFVVRCFARGLRQVVLLKKDPDAKTRQSSPIIRSLTGHGHSSPSYHGDSVGPRH